MPGLGDWGRVVIKGTGPGSEVWQTGFSVISTVAITSQSGLQTLLNNIAPLVDTWWTSAKANCYAIYTYTEVDMYWYQGVLTTAEFQAQSIRTPTAGSLVAQGSPIDIACVVSLRTAQPGRSGRGRMYVPCHQSVNTSTANWASTVNSGLGTATRTLFNGIISGTTGYPAVVSRTHATYQLVTGLVTDSRPDVQRRRENRLAIANTQVLTVP